MIQSVSKILERCISSETNINPTILYNEGWMIRLLVELSKQEKLKLPHVDFGCISNWYSEGLLSSPFLARRKHDKLAEGYTHTDIALGDFHVDPSNKGDIVMDGEDGIFGVIEAKMGSKLSSGTANAPEYDQASRNLACIAFNTLYTKHDLYFAVAAPAEKILEHRFSDMVDVSRMVSKIAQRFDMYRDDHEVSSVKNQVLDRARGCTCFTISYEAWISEIKGRKERTFLNEFKEQCYKFNRIKTASEPRTSSGNWES